MNSTSPLAFTVGDLLDIQGDARGNHPFLICDDDVLTYADAADRSAALALGLIASGCAHGSRVGILYPNGVGFAIASLAAARFGAVAVPLSTFSTAIELGSLLRNADVDMVLCTSTYRRQDYVTILAQAIPELDLGSPPPLFAPSVPSLRKLSFDGSDGVIDEGWTLQSLERAEDTINPDVLMASQFQVRPADALVVVHTSGSTAEPKGVLHAHGSLLNHLHVLNGLRRYRKEDILFCNSPFFWIGGYAYALLGTLEAGGTLVCSNATQSSDVLDVIERTRPTMVNGFAQSVVHLSNDPSFPRRDLSSITRGNLYPIMPEAVRPSDPELRHNMLGMTETGSVCLATADDSEQPETRRGSFGRPVPDIEAKVVDSQSDIAEVGEVGELCLRGPAVMTGYLRKERHETFDRDGWYHTGDLFHVDDEGFFYFHGRQSEMIKTSGANVSPREVEAAILEETGLVAHVFGEDDEAAGQLVVAVIRTLPTSAVPDPEQLRLHLRSRLSAYKVPKRIVTLDEKDVPMMSSGKLDMRALRELVHAS
jgi:acyl-CoA synthetase (AMP-forming)/AMP-acid ligase II